MNDSSKIIYFLEQREKKAQEWPMLKFFSRFKKKYKQLTKLRE